MSTQITGTFLVEEVLEFKAQRSLFEFLTGRNSADVTRRARSLLAGSIVQGEIHAGDLTELGDGVERTIWLEAQFRQGIPEFVNANTGPATLVCEGHNLPVRQGDILQFRRRLD